MRSLLGSVFNSCSHINVHNFGFSFLGARPPVLKDSLELLFHVLETLRSLLSLLLPLLTWYDEAFLLFAHRLPTAKSDKMFPRAQGRAGRPEDGALQGDMLFLSASRPPSTHCRGFRKGLFGFSFPRGSPIRPDDLVEPQLVRPKTLSPRKIHRPQK